MESIKFKIDITKQNLSNFMIYHCYTHFDGLFGVFISLLALTYLVMNINQLDLTRILVFGLITLLFTVINPLMLISRAGTQVKRNAMIKEPIEYELCDKELILRQGDNEVKVTWDKVLRVRDSGMSILVYMSRARGYIWPKKQLGGQYDEIVRILKDKVPSNKIKIKGSR